jgi:hypothetical protein
MAYLLTCALIALLFALLLLGAPKLLGSIGDWANKTVVLFDGLLMNSHLWIGIVLLALGGWMMYVGFNYPDPFLTAAWLLTVAFGLLFLLFPGWLKWLSSVSNVVLLSTDELIMGTRRIVGIVLLIVSLYLFYALTMVR